MVVFVITISVILVLLVVAQSIISSAYWLEFRRRRPTVDPATLPKAAVILSLRGSDPFLPRTLKALLDLDYVDYEIHIVVDSDQDPAWQQVKEVMQDDVEHRLHATSLRNPSTSCGLKCSSLIQAIEDLDDSVEVVAFIDADVIPHRLWLRDLVMPLKDPRVGVATGNRWFVPRLGDWGSLFRYVWNVGAVVQVWSNRIVWGGSMAMRVDAIHDIDVLAAWRVSLAEDSVASGHVKKHGYRVAFVPQVMMCNQEQIGFWDFHNWVQRQLVIAKLAGPQWRLIPIHAFNLLVFQFLAAAAVWMSLSMNRMDLVWFSSLSWLSYWMSSFTIIFFLERAVRRMSRENGREIQWNNWRTRLRLVPTIVATHVVYPLALAGALRRRKFTWRGIDYEFDQRGKVSMTEYRPYSDVVSSSSESLI